MQDGARRKAERSGQGRPRTTRVLFKIDAATAHAGWFTALSHGAWLTAPVVTSPSVWQALDAPIRWVMLAQAAMLAPMALR
jgi:arginine exporter protein ArgO